MTALRFHGLSRPPGAYSSVVLPPLSEGLGTPSCPVRPLVFQILANASLASRLHGVLGRAEEALACSPLLNGWSFSVGLRTGTADGTFLTVSAYGGRSGRPGWELSFPLHSLHLEMAVVSEVMES